MHLKRINSVFIEALVPLYSDFNIDIILGALVRIFRTEIAYFGRHGHKQLLVQSYINTVDFWLI